MHNHSYFLPDIICLLYPPKTDSPSEPVDLVKAHRFRFVTPFLLPISGQHKRIGTDKHQRRSAFGQYRFSQRMPEIDRSLDNQKG